MKYILLILLIPIMVYGCNTNQATRPTNELSDESYLNEDKDTAIVQAMLEAKKTLSEFDKALTSNKYDTSTFILKVRFPAPNGFEYLWIRSIALNNGHYSGIVANVPLFTKKVVFGQRVLFEREDVADWLYGDSLSFCGGFTNKALLSKLGN